MNGLKDRERAFENKYTHEEELNFKARARRDTLIGLWAAEKLEMTPRESEAYAGSIFELGMARKGSDAVRDKIYADLKDASVDISEYLVEKRMLELMEDARLEMQG